MWKITTLAAGLVMVAAGHAQDAPVKPPVPTATVLKAAHLFDGKTGVLTSPGLIVVENERIVAVGQNSVIPAGAQVIDLGDATLLPGFIDAHTHISSDHNDQWAQGFYEDMLRFPVEQSYHAERNARATLRAGVTTVREVGAH